MPRNIVVHAVSHTTHKHVDIAGVCTACGHIVYMDEACYDDSGKLFCPGDFYVPPKQTIRPYGKPLSEDNPVPGHLLA